MPTQSLYGTALFAWLTAMGVGTLIASVVHATDEVPPRIVRVVEAVYPPEALRRGEGAVVRLEIDVDDAGRASSVRVIEPSGRSAFDDAAVNAAREFEFEPAQRDGHPVPARIRYRYRFTPPLPRPIDEDSPRPQATSTTTSSSTSPTTSVLTGLSNPTGTLPNPSHSTGALGLPPDGTQQGVTVFARPPSREIGRREVTAEEIRRIPGARGDALIALQSLPGVSRPSFGLGQFIVRSSAPDDTLVTLEGQPIALPFHFAGLSSTIATDLIERIEFLPGNFSARYGRVAGGVINITLHAPQRDRVRIAGDLDPIDAGVYASMPLGKNTSIGIGARRSIIDLAGPPFYDLFSSGAGTQFRQWPAYYDGQIALDWNISPSDSIRLVASATDDQLILNFRDPNANDPNVRGDLGTHLAYAGLQARWRHRFSPHVIHTFSPAIAYNFSSASLGPQVSVKFQSVVFNLRDELEVQFSSHARAFFGVDFQCGNLDNNVHAPPLPTNGIQDPIDPNTIVSYKDQRPFCSSNSTGKRASINPAAYAEAEIDASAQIRLLAGVRADYFGLLNSGTISPRAMARIALHPRITARIGYGLYSSPPRGYYIVPGFGNPNLGPEQWSHSTAGINMEILPGILDLDTDVFLKFGEHVVAPSARPVSNSDPTPEHFANTGSGRVIGGEWMVRVRPGQRSPVYGMIAYTYQHATRSATLGAPSVTYTYNQPHNLSVVLGAVLPRGWEVGIRARFASGNVSPLVTGALFDADHDVALTLTDPLHPGHLPDYFSFDWRVSKRFRLGPLRCEAILEVLNTFNVSNAESVIYSYDRRTSQLINGLPILPSLGLRAEY